ncbi:MAG: hypothetical protein GX459_03190 [Bacteroidales bacterium]|nr:hypothetical protein [Bacteroidales bacterium]
MDVSEKFESWAIVELFGHNRIAGKCSEQNVAGTNMLRIDVPETEKNPAFTRLLGHAAIYAINPVTEEVATHWAKMLHCAPINAWDVREFMEKNKLSLNQPSDDGDSFGDPDTD